MAVMHRRSCVKLEMRIICDVDCYKCGEYDSDMKTAEECNVEQASYAQEDCNNDDSCWVGPPHCMGSLF